jgi:hypothetical protein
MTQITIPKKYEDTYQDIHFKFADRLPYLWKSMLYSFSPDEV